VAGPIVSISIMSIAACVGDEIDRGWGSCLIVSDSAGFEEFKADWAFVGVEGFDLQGKVHNRPRE